MSIDLSPRCMFCKHKIKGVKCKAFPDRIPDEIFFDARVEHLEPYPGDHGIQFELMDNLSKERLEAYRVGFLNK